MSFGFLLLFGLASVGLTHILVDGKIFDWLRQSVKNISFLNDIFSCHQCMGFYAGLLCAAVLHSYIGVSVNLSLVPMLLLLACAASFLAMFSRAVLDYLTLNVNIPFSDQ